MGGAGQVNDVQGSADGRQPCQLAARLLHCRLLAQADAELALLGHQACRPAKMVTYIAQKRYLWLLVRLLDSCL